MASSAVRPYLVMADKDGNIYEHPELYMLCRRNNEWALPKPDELMPLPDESDLFLLPNRHAAGLNPETGLVEIMEDLAVAAFAAPAHTLTAHPVYETEENAPMLPLFAYGAVGLYNDRFYVCAKKVDEDQRQVFRGISQNRILEQGRKLAKMYPNNRLIQHIVNNCAFKYNCPAARNLCLGRYEAPLPTSNTCNARCVACISQQDKDSEICATPQNRMTFTPNVDEIVELMRHHGRKETKEPIFSFGQGCEGEPLSQADLLIASVQEFRKHGGLGTVNLNTNASRPDKVEELAKAGLSSMRVSMNSAREEVYNLYHRPQGYSFEDVKNSIKLAKKHNVFISLNLLYFPGITDTENEVDALCNLIKECDVDFIQLRNLNIDPEYYPKLFDGIDFGACMGFINFRKRLRKEFDMKFGYFNPFIK